MYNKCANILYVFVTAGHLLFWNLYTDGLHYGMIGLDIYAIRLGTGDLYLYDVVELGKLCETRVNKLGLDISVEV